MIQLFDTLGQFEKPDIILCNPNRDELYSLNTARNLKHIMRFNAVSEFTFMIEQYVDDILIPAYENVIAKKLVYISGVGYFIVSEVTENTNGQIPYKDVVCYSQEIELSFKKLSMTGTKKFYNPIPVPGTTTLMDIILSYLPSWSLGDIDSDLWNLYRTFDVADNNIYNFMMTDVETAYGCVFTFDTINKTISATAIPNIAFPTDIYLSYDNLLQNASLKEIASELCTKLYVYGSNGLGISSVNPLGSNAIYNFDYYKNTNWMTQSLIDAIDAWETLIASQLSGYSTKLLELIALNTTLITKNGELTVLNSSLSAQEVLLQVAVEAGTDLTTIHDAILVIEGSITTKEAEITSTQVLIDAKTAEITGIVNSLSFENNFTTLEKQELDSFIFENTYQNTSLTLTDGMTPNERQDVAQQLYDEAVNLVMPKVAIPRYEFTADTTNFPLLQEFSSFTNQLEMACTVTINVRDTYTITPALLEMVVTYDNPSDFSMTFSNRLRLDNAGFIFTDIVGNNNSVSTTVGFNSQQWGNWEANYKDEVSTFITSALDASVNMLMSSDDEEITISNVGLRGQKLISPGVYDNKKVWLTSNLLAFTKDNWQTSLLALGEIKVDGSSQYGLIADVVVGKLLAGNQLLISNDSNTFSLDASGAVLSNGYLSITNAVSEIRIDPNTGIRIQKKTSTTGSIGIGVSSNTTASSVNMLTWSHTTPNQSERLMIVTISYYKESVAPSAVSSVKYGSQILTKAIGTIIENNGSEIWYLKNPVVGTATVKVSFDDSESVIVEAGSIVYWNINQLSPIQGTASASGTSTTPSVTITSSTNNLVTDSLSYNLSTTFSVGAGQTQIYNISPSSPQNGASSYESGASSVTMSWTGSSGFWLTTAVSLNKTTTVYNLSDTFSLDVNGNAVFAGSLSAASGTFTGVLSGVTGAFSGSITATSGTIANWIIDTNGMHDAWGNARLWPINANTYEFRLGGIQAVYSFGVNQEVLLTPRDSIYMASDSLQLWLPDSPTSLTLRGSPTVNSNVVVSAGMTLVFRSGMLFDYF